MAPDVDDSWQREAFDHPKGEEDPGRWQVHIAVPSSDSAVLEAAAPTVYPAEHFEIRAAAGDDGDDVILTVRVPASKPQEAIDEAAHIYRKMRTAASLSPDPVLVLGYLSPWWLQQRTGTLSKEGGVLLKDGRFELAVVRFQTACELAIADTFRSLLKRTMPPGDVAKLIPRPATLADDRSKALLTLLTGRRVQDTPWWPSYREHLKRRHGVVHDGLEVTHGDATASYKASIELREWLLEVVIEADGRDPHQPPPSAAGEQGSVPAG